MRNMVSIDDSIKCIYKNMASNSIEIMYKPDSPAFTNYSYYNMTYDDELRPII